MKKRTLLLIGSLLVGAVGSTPVLYAQEQWKQSKSEHFFVYYHHIPQDFVNDVLQSAETYYSKIVDELGFWRYKGWSFKNRARIYIYDDQQDYVRGSHQANWSAGAAYYMQRTIRTYPSEEGFFDSLLPHELGHIIFHQFIGENVEIPTWFDEGVAMYQEKARRWGSNEKVREAIKDGTFIPLPQLNRTRLTKDSSDEKVELFYSEAASVVYFMIQDRGNFKFLNFCRQLRGGDKFPHALELIYPRMNNLENLNKAWVNYLEGQ